MPKYKNFFLDNFQINLKDYFPSEKKWVNSLLTDQGSHLFNQL